MGADPGPACYGRQSSKPTPTVTDAHVVLGHIPPWLRLAGTLELDVDAAHAAVSRLAGQCGLGLYDAAEGILRIAEVNMGRAIKRISVERGHDVRDFALLPFGGAGGLHAARLAAQIGIGSILVPVNPGLLSALGMLAAGPLYNFSRTTMVRIRPGDAGEVSPDTVPPVFAAFAELERQAAAALQQEGIDQRDWVVERRLDMRYAGQSYELSVAAGEAGFRAEFEAEHQRLYGYTSAERDIELVNARVFAAAVPQAPSLPRLDRRASGTWRDHAKQGSIRAGGAEAPCWFVDRGALLAGDKIAGPAIITEYSSTTLVPAGWMLAVTASGALKLERAKGAGDA
jgi:N-methylhydantoinase A